MRTARGIFAAGEISRHMTPAQEIALRVISETNKRVDINRALNFIRQFHRAVRFSAIET